MASAKLERLMKLLAALLHTPRPIPAAVLQRQVEGYPSDPVAFHRQFSRDKDDLRVLGVPLIVEMVPDSDPPVEGYRIDPDEYYLEGPDLDAEEMAALHLATRLIDVAGGPDPSSLFKLGGVPNRPTDAVAPRVSVPADPNLGAIFAAIQDAHNVVFPYRAVEREVRPQALGFQRGHWYLTGWDVDARAERVYRLDRFEGPVTPGTRPSEPSTGGRDLATMKPWRIGGDETIEVTLRVAAVAVPTVAAQVGTGREMTTSEDGSATVRIEVTDVEGLRSWVLGFGPDVEVVAPPEVRAGITAWLDAVIEAAT